MTDVKLKVDAGACRFITEITGSTEDSIMIKLTLKTDCPSAKKLAAALEEEVMVFDAMATPMTENQLFATCGKYLEHAACPLPSALVKVCEVAGGMGLKKDVSFQFIG